MKNKLLGGLYGLAIADAVGVPFEFKPPCRIPELCLIDIVDRSNGEFKKTYPNIPWGTWSDDTSLALCLMDALMSPSTIDEKWETKFVGNMLNWRFHGLYAVDAQKFDIGNQTSWALSELEEGVFITERDDPDSYGNGALMRTLPTALLAVNEVQLDYWNRMHVRATHANQLCVLISLIYAQWATRLLSGDSLDDALNYALQRYESDREFVDEYTVLMDGEHHEHKGSGYVVDSFWSAYQALKMGTDFRTTVQHAIRFGNDTDTTACIAGGLAGIIYGYDNIPEEWLAGLREKNVIDEFADRMLKHKEIV